MYKVQCPSCGKEFDIVIPGVPPTLPQNSNSAAWLVVKIILGIFIVVILLGILAAIVVPQFAETDSQAHAEMQQADLQILNTQVQLFNFKEGRMPKNLAELEAEGYIREVPMDPASGEPYAYDPKTGKVTLPD